ncbi:MAG: VWA domain-containing protein [Blastocatellia bacterium]
MRPGIAYVCLSLAVSLTVPIVCRQEQSQSPQPAQIARPPQDPVKLRVDMVVLDAQVLQKKTARVVGGLTKSDFTLYEDGVRQQVTQFGQDSLPLSVLLLVDRGGCLDPFSSEVQRATLEALNRLKPNDEVALMAFSDDTELVLGFRYDRQQIAEAIDRMPRHDERANHCFNRAFYQAAKLMERAANPAGRRVIIMITGVTRDLGCTSGPSFTETRNEVLESGAVVCGLIPSSAEQKAENGIMGTIASVAGVFKVPTSSLKQFADETGGEIFSEKAAELDHAFGTLVDHLRNRYTLGFVSSNTAHDGTYRKLKVDVVPEVARREGGEVVVKTRRGYLAPKTRAGN